MGISIAGNAEYIRQNYPELRLIERTNNEATWQGRLCVHLQYKHIEISIAPRLEIVLSSDYPLQPPKVFDTDHRFVWDHKYPDNSLCVATEFDLLVGLAGSTCLSDYFERFLFPYFISYESWMETREPIFGERTHGAPGIYESLGNYFGVDSQRTTELRRLLRWASKKTKFRRIFERFEWAPTARRFSHRIGILRKANLIGLKRLYECLHRADQPEKLYYEYQKRLG